MFETLDKVILAGLGAVSMTKEKAEHIFEEYVEKGKAQHENKESFVQEVMDTAEKARDNLQKVIADQIQKSLAHSSFVTKNDIQRLEDKLDQLLAEKEE